MCRDFDMAHGSSPYAAAAFGPEGTLYGTAWNGGGSNIGTVYRIDPAQGFGVLHDFGQRSGICPGLAALFGL